MTDAVLLAGTAVDANAIQAFLESSPYGTRSWLADYKIDNKRFADVLIEEVPRRATSIRSCSSLACRSRARS